MARKVNLLAISLVNTGDEVGQGCYSLAAAFDQGLTDMQRLPSFLSSMIEYLTQLLGLTQELRMQQCTLDRSEAYVTAAAL